MWTYIHPAYIASDKILQVDHGCQRQQYSVEAGSRNIPTMLPGSGLWSKNPTQKASSMFLAREGLQNVSCCV